MNGRKSGRDVTETRINVGLGGVGENGVSFCVWADLHSFYIYCYLCTLCNGRQVICRYERLLLKAVDCFSFSHFLYVNELQYPGLYMSQNCSITQPPT